MREHAFILAVLAAFAGAAACQAPPGPSAEAKAAYIAAHAADVRPAPRPTPAAKPETAAPAPPTDAASTAPGPSDAAQPPPVAPDAPPAARARITAVSGEGLPDADAGPGVTDAYLEIEYDGQRFRTSTVGGSQDPTWGDSFVVELRDGAVLGLRLKDEDNVSDETMGVWTDVFPPLRSGEHKEIVVPFRGGAGGTVRIAVYGIE